jgi:integrase
LFSRRPAPSCPSPLHPALLAAIKAAPAKGVTLIGDANGRPIQRATLTLIMRKAVELAGLPSRCVPHGLRKAIMRRLAESGSSAKEIAAISGHRSLKEIERYTAAADQVTLSKAAIAKGDAPDFVEVGEAGIAVEDSMRHLRCLQLVG